MLNDKRNILFLIFCLIQLELKSQSVIELVKDSIYIVASQPYFDLQSTNYDSVINNVPENNVIVIGKIGLIRGGAYLKFICYNNNDSSYEKVVYKNNIFISKRYGVYSYYEERDSLFIDLEPKCYFTSYNGYKSNGSENIKVYFVRYKGKLYQFGSVNDNSALELMRIIEKNIFNSKDILESN